MSTLWKRCSPQSLSQPLTIATTLTSGETSVRVIMTSDADIASTGPQLFPGRASAGSSFLKYAPCYGNYSTQLSTSQLAVVVPVQLALVGPRPPFFAPSKVASLAQKLATLACACSRQI